MARRKSSRKKKIILACIILLALTVLAVLILLQANYIRQKKEADAIPTRYETDLQRLTAEDYSVAFFSMYPTDNFLADDFSYFFGENMLITSMRIPDYTTLCEYMELMAHSGNEITTVYLGISPDKLDSEDLSDLVSAYPDIFFQIIPANPALDYWTLLSEEECARILNAYRDLMSHMFACDNASVFFFGGSEWLIANPSNYEGYFQINSDIAKTQLANTYATTPYLMTEESFETSMDTLEALIEARRATPEKYPDLSDWEIVFFGDSVIGNFTDSTSIPAIVRGLTGAQVYNLAYGGASATDMIDDTGQENCSLPDMVKAFIRQDVTLLPTSHPQLADVLSAYEESKREDNLCFVLNFGLNDYFAGLPIASDDPMDTWTFSGALRTAVQLLRDEYPDAVIVLNTPNYITFFNNGRDPRGAEQNILIDYVSALQDLSEELELGLLNNYSAIKVNKTNYLDYLLPDLCHPNETGRFIIAEDLSLLLKRLCTESE